MQPPTLITWIVIAIAVAVGIGVYLSWRAGRLDRLHTRLETARAALDVALVRRSSVALELASSSLLDPAASLLLAEAAHEARRLDGQVRPAEGAGRWTDPMRQAGQHQEPARSRELAESDLTRALRAVLAQPGCRTSLAVRDGAEELLTELDAAAGRVLLARRFYNDAVTVTRQARRRPLVRLCRLAGGAGLPEFFDIDDALDGHDDSSDGPTMWREVGI